MYQLQHEFPHAHITIVFTFSNSNLILFNLKNTNGWTVWWQKEICRQGWYNDPGFPRIFQLKKEFSRTKWQIFGHFPGFSKSELLFSSFFFKIHLPPNLYNSKPYLYIKIHKKCPYIFCKIYSDMEILDFWYTRKWQWNEFKCFLMGHSEIRISRKQGKFWFLVYIMSFKCLFKIYIQRLI